MWFMRGGATGIKTRKLQNVRETVKLKQECWLAVRTAIAKETQYTGLATITNRRKKHERGPIPKKKKKTQ